MGVVTGRATETHQWAITDGILSTSPLLLTATARAAAWHSGSEPELRLIYRRRGSGLAVTRAEDGVVVAWSRPTGHLHLHTLHHRGRDWQLHVNRTQWGSYRPARSGAVTGRDGELSIQSDYLHYVSEWYDHRRTHRGWITGRLETTGTIPPPIVLLGLRLTLGAHWFDLRTGLWFETRRPWDFAGF